MIVSLIIIGAPAFDVLFVMKERFFHSSKQSLLNRFAAMFIPDNRHIHHLFIENGYSKRNTVVIVCLLNILFCFTMIVYYHYWKLNNVYSLLFMLLAFYYFVRNFLIKKLD
jgi:UDP-N-acetylmuramyl pentapeptide phosphotransferase/UDP-N-acetylglucosamine-1-phosphate transferase